MHTHRIIGGGGTQLHVIETGNPKGRPILFIHGFSQCWLAWSRQLKSDLADDYRLIAMDGGMVSLINLMTAIPNRDYGLTTSTRP